MTTKREKRREQREQTKVARNAYLENQVTELKARIKELESSKGSDALDSAVYAQLLVKYNALKDKEANWSKSASYTELENKIHNLEQTRKYADSAMVELAKANASLNEQLSEKDAVIVRLASGGNYQADDKHLNHLKSELNQRANELENAKSELAKQTNELLKRSNALSHIRTELKLERDANIVLSELNRDMIIRLENYEMEEVVKESRVFNNTNWRDRKQKNIKNSPFVIWVVSMTIIFGSTLFIG